MNSIFKRMTKSKAAKIWANHIEKSWNAYTLTKNCKANDSEKQRMDAKMKRAKYREKIRHYFEKTDNTLLETKEQLEEWRSMFKERKYATDECREETNVIRKNIKNYYEKISKDIIEKNKDMRCLKRK